MLTATEAHHHHWCVKISALEIFLCFSNSLRLRADTWIMLLFKWFRYVIFLKNIFSSNFGWNVCFSIFPIKNIRRCDLLKRKEKVTLHSKSILNDFYFSIIYLVKLSIFFFLVWKICIRVFYVKFWSISYSDLYFYFKIS